MVNLSSSIEIAANLGSMSSSLYWQSPHQKRRHKAYSSFISLAWQHILPKYMLNGDGQGIQHHHHRNGEMVVTHEISEAKKRGPFEAFVLVINDVFFSSAVTPRSRMTRRYRAVRVVTLASKLCVWRRLQPARPRS